MKIALDLDEVTVDFLDHFLIFYHKKTGNLFEKKNITSYDWWSHLSMTKDELTNLINEFHLNHGDEIPAVNNAIASINKLIDNHEITIITSRPVIFKERTESWIEKHLGNIPLDVYFSSDFAQHIGKVGKTKSELCKDLGVSIILEDSGEYALDCAKNGTKAILFDKPWNENFEHKNIIRVNNWVEALGAINNLTAKNP